MRRIGRVILRPVGRAFWLPLLALFFAIVAIGCAGAEGVPVAGVQAALPGEPARPNVVLIVADDMRADDMRFMPQAERLLGDQGTTFSNAFVTNSLCCPSRATILRGQYSGNTGITTNVPPNGGYEGFKNKMLHTSTLATWLDDAGYETALMGKYLNGYEVGASDYLKTPPGWDSWYAMLGDPTYYNWAAVKNGRVGRFGKLPRHYSTDVLGTWGSNFAANAPEPFFSYVAPAAPRVFPFTAARRDAGTVAAADVPRPASFAEADVSDKPAWVRKFGPLSASEKSAMDESRRKRAQTLGALDDLVARVVGSLERTGRLENTHIIFTSDNGLKMGEHGTRRSKVSAYEEDIRVPLLMRGPGVTAGAVEERMVLNNDLAPTIAELAGSPASEAMPAFVDGRSLAPLLRGEDPAGEPWRTAFMVEHQRYDSSDPYTAVVPSYEAVRTERFTYVEYATGERELYDLKADPAQLQSLHGDPAHADERTALAARLRSLRDCAGTACKAAEDQ